MKATRFIPKSTREISSDEIADALKSDRGMIWVDFAGPTDEDYRFMAEVFGFHPLALEDVRKQDQRPKAEEFADHLFLILNPIANTDADANTDNEDSLFRELDVFIGPNYVVTVRQPIEPTIEEALRRLDPARRNTPLVSSFLLYIIMDVIVDDYFPTLERIELELEQIGDQIIDEPNDDLLARLSQLRRTLNEIGRYIWPQREIINVLMNHELVFITENSQYHLRDVSDHLYQITDMLHDFRDTINNLINLYISSVSHQLNQVVSRLTVFTIVIGTLTIFSGFYGMNFAGTWPPLDRPWSLPLVTGSMLLTISVVLVIFRRRGWF